MTESAENIFAVEIEHGPWDERALWRATLRREPGTVELTRWRDGGWTTFEGRWEKHRVICEDVPEEVVNELTGALRKCIKGDVPNLHTREIAMPV